ncbi:MAG TPA: electron transfer flavoprotein-ubiquinone oxidoreductase [Methyloceanibacter sp.]|nr:electron transfer flavoprotein-ubiquinone oxidoreductase [Methyloceanibacter sp.]
MEFDVVIVGAGPAGLATAIRLKQLSTEKGKELSVVVLEKGSEVGAHILSGAVIDPVGLDRLIPDWREKGSPLTTKVTEDRFYYLWKTGGFRVPNIFMPPLMSNHGCYTGSLGSLCRWLAEQAEALGVEVYPGFSVVDVIFGSDGAIDGVITGDMGVARDGSHKDNYTPGIAITGKYTLFAEGARGSLSKMLIGQLGLDEESGPQKFGIGLKELWEVPAEKHKPGLVQHTMGWPLEDKTGGGSFLYHFGERLMSVGFVVHLDYANPYLNPFKEFQRAKTHPLIRQHLEGGKRIAYGARALTEGGLQAIPRLAFPGGALIGCAAGFMNVPRIKGSHNAMLSGMMAAEAAFAAIEAGRSRDVLEAYPEAVRASAMAKELKKVRNVKPLWSRLGTRLGVMLGGIDMWLNTIFPFLSHTLKHLKPDHATLHKTATEKPIEYEKPDGVLTFDILSSVFLSGTNHAENQLVHLKLADPSIPIERNLPEYAEPAQRYCPALVYEVVEESDRKRFQINAQNCVHCKTCDVKDPAQNITWVPPEGGDGPNYVNM